MNTPEPGPQIMPGTVYLSIDNRARHGAVEFDETWTWMNFLEDNTGKWRSVPASAVSQIVWTNEEDQ
jgi:hypothetical protein